MLTRRKFLKGVFAGTVLAGAGTFMYAWRIEPHWVTTVVRDLPIVGLPNELEGCTLVQVSDLHVGPVVDQDYLAETLEQVSAIEADLIAITGDFMTCEGNEQVEPVLAVLEHLQAPPLGILAIMGNHDYGYNWSRNEVADELAGELGRMGITVLRNDTVDIEGLQIVGLDDYWSPKYALSETMSGIDQSVPTLVLCHNPDAADTDGWAGYRGWILSGHTHGGQVDPPLMSPPILPVQNPRYSAGEFDLGDGRRMYINRGLGYSRRVRFNSRPEITVFRLTSNGSTT